MGRHESGTGKSAGILEVIPAVVFVGFILLGLAAAASAAIGATSETKPGPLPAKVAVPDSPAGKTTGWDIDGDGRPDMVEVERGAGETANVETAYDFDGDGNPDYVRSGHSQRDFSTGPSPLR